MPTILFYPIYAKSENFELLYNELAETLSGAVKKDLTAWFNRITAKWKHKPAIKSKIEKTRKSMTVWVYPTGINAQIWRYVSLGTKGPYPIPKPGNTSAKTLKFRKGYKARTTTSGGYRGPGKATGKMVFRKRVMHPGIKARKFEKHIARWYYPTFRKTMKNAVTRGLRKSRA